MAVAFVQSLGNANNTTAGASITLTTTASVTAGNIIVFTGHTRGTAAPTTMTISGGSLTWTTLNLQSNATGVTGVAIAWAPAPAGLASSTVLTATWDVSVGKHIVSAMEVSGVDLGATPLATGQVNASGVTDTGSPGTTVIGDSFAVGAWELAASSTGMTGTPGTNTGTATGGTITEFLDLENGTSTENYAYVEYQVLTTPGTVNLNFTPSVAKTGVAVIAVFAGISVTPPPRHSPFHESLNIGGRPVAARRVDSPRLPQVAWR